MRILINCLPASNESLVDYIDQALGAHELPVSPVILRPHETDPDQVMLTGWRLQRGVVTHSFPLEFVRNPACREELDRALEVFLLCLNAATV